MTHFHTASMFLYGAILPPLKVSYQSVVKFEEINNLLFFDDVLSVFEQLVLFVDVSSGAAFRPYTFYRVNIF